MHSPKAPKPSIAQQQSASRTNAPVQPFAGSTGSQLGGLLGDQSMWFSYMRPRSRPPLGSLPTDPGAAPADPGPSVNNLTPRLEGLPTNSPLNNYNRTPNTLTPRLDGLPPDSPLNDNNRIPNNLTPKLDGLPLNSPLNNLTPKRLPQSVINKAGLW